MLTKKMPNRLIKDPERYKTTLCRTYERSNNCPYAGKCQFAHGKDELRTRKQARHDAFAQAPFVPFQAFVPLQPRILISDPPVARDDSDIWSLLANLPALSVDDDHILMEEMITDPPSTLT